MKVPLTIEIHRESIVIDHSSNQYSLSLFIRDVDKPKTCEYGKDYSLSANVPRRVDMRLHKVGSQVSVVVHRLRGILLSEGKLKMSTVNNPEYEIDACPYEGMSVSGPNDDRRIPCIVEQ